MELIPTLSDDWECGSIVTNDWSFCPGVRKEGIEKAVGFILWVSKERIFSNFLFQISPIEINYTFLEGVLSSWTE